MATYTYFFLFLFLTTHICAMEHTIIPDSAYYIRGKLRKSSNEIIREVTFYTYDGTRLITKEENLQAIIDQENRLDPQAPKPQPKTYQLTYKPPLALGCGITKGSAHYSLQFFDKHRNIIEQYPYDQINQKILVILPSSITLYSFNDIEELKKVPDFPLDLSIVKEAKNNQLAEESKNENSNKKSKRCIVQ